MAIELKIGMEKASAVREVRWADEVWSQQKRQGNGREKIRQ